MSHNNQFTSLDSFLRRNFIPFNAGHIPSSMHCKAKYCTKSHHYHVCNNCGMHNSNHLTRNCQIAVQHGHNSGVQPFSVHRGGVHPFAVHHGGVHPIAIHHSCIYPIVIHRCVFNPIAIHHSSHIIGNHMP